MMLIAGQVGPDELAGEVLGVLVLIQPNLTPLRLPLAVGLGIDGDRAIGENHHGNGIPGLQVLLVHP